MVKLKKYLEEQELTQDAFAKKLGVKQPTVWEWINGHSRPSAENLLQISRETGISINELLEVA